MCSAVRFGCCFRGLGPRDGGDRLGRLLVVVLQVWRFDCSIWIFGFLSVISV